jgi:hypothetical protein
MLAFSPVPELGKAQRSSLGSLTIDQGVPGS